MNTFFFKFENILQIYLSIYAPTNNLRISLKKNGRYQRYFICKQTRLNLFSYNICMYASFLYAPNWFSKNWNLNILQGPKQKCLTFCHSYHLRCNRS